MVLSTFFSTSYDTNDITAKNTLYQCVSIGGVHVLVVADFSKSDFTVQGIVFCLGFHHGLDVSKLFGGGVHHFFYF